MSRADTHHGIHEKCLQALQHPAKSLTNRQRRWIQPRGRLFAISYSLLYFINRMVMGLLFRVTVEGRAHLPDEGPFIVTPNHSSAFDPPILAACLPLQSLLNTYWAGKRSTVLHNPLRTILSWLTRVIPIHNETSALAAAVSILDQGANLIWFPEGRRSTDGTLQPFKPGIALLLSRCDVPVIPVYLDGAYDAFPTGAWFPRWRAGIVVRFSEPLTAEQLGMSSLSDRGIQAVVENLRQQIVRLRDG